MLEKTVLVLHVGYFEEEEDGCSMLASLPLSYVTITSDSLGTRE